LDCYQRLVDQGDIDETLFLLIMGYWEFFATGRHGLPAQPPSHGKAAHAFLCEGRHATHFFIED
jgi:hypothetical protein